MNTLEKEETTITPQISIDAHGEAKISGKSLPLDPNSWYQDVFEWLTDYSNRDPKV